MQPSRIKQGAIMLLQRSPASQSAGFTLLESLIVVMVLGILAAISAQGWNAWWQARQLTLSQQEIYQALRQTQNNALQERLEWQFSLRQQANVLEWATHPQLVDPAHTPVWKPLEQSIAFDLSNTTLPQKNGVYYVQFDDRGKIDSQLGRVTLTSAAGGAAKRCVIVSTLIGALRQGRQQPTPDSSNSYCY
jgi:prepilin-type N-terminal cleavage/methylation domain-containing protein